jgi:hypothetical protein
VEVLTFNIFTFSLDISTTNNAVLDGGDIVQSGGFANSKEYLHQFSINFEHEIWFGGGSGDSGGNFFHIAILRTKLNL